MKIQFCSLGEAHWHEKLDSLLNYVSLYICVIFHYLCNLYPPENSLFAFVCILLDRIQVYSFMFNVKSFFIYEHITKS